MIKQKVISVSIYVADAANGPNQINEVELDTVNKYLDEGYIIVDRFTSPTNSKYDINITFVLQKETSE
jgi:hypothetical protein